jgi:hypothetical protein
MINLKRGIIAFLLYYSGSFAQTGNLTSSPYSLFGLGRINEVSTGRTNALGKSGIALDSNSEINSLNPASFASIPKNSVFAEIGMKTENTLYTNNGDQQRNSVSNFANFSFALAFDDKSGMGFSLFPYTNVGYNISAITGTVEGTSDRFMSNITGSGGLNNLQFNYGRKITENLKLGARANLYFGKISEVETVYIEDDNLVIDETHNYKGVQLGLGAQYKAGNNFDFGFTVNFPTSLIGSKEQTVSSVIAGVENTIDESEGTKINSFNMPLELGFGAKYRYKSFTFNADFKESFWKGTNDEDLTIGDFTNQKSIGAGIEYFRSGRSYLDKTKFRVGANYDTGYMTVEGTQIKNLALTTGLGLPMGLRTNTYINLSYSYGQRGQVSNTLIRENYHLITINLCFEDIWFKRRQYE